MNISDQSLVTGGDDHFLPKLITAINQATRIDIALSFIRSYGLELIKSALEDALEADVKVRIVKSFISEGIQNIPNTIVSFQYLLPNRFTPTLI